MDVDTNESNSSEIALRQLPLRTTRGRRMTSLLGEALENDETFWGQEAFEENEEDDDFEFSTEPEDIFDSDFDDSDIENATGTSLSIGAEEEEAEKRIRAEERREKIQNRMRLESRFRRRDSRTSERGDLESRVIRTLQGENLETDVGQKRSERKDIQSKSADSLTDGLPTDREKRKSTAARTEETTLRLEKDRVAMEARKKPNRIVYHIPTQEERLETARKTIELNLISLNILTELEEERKRVPVKNRRIVEGPSVTYISSLRLGKIHTIEVSSSTNQDENMESESLSCIGDIQTERVIFSDETSVYLHHLQQTNSFTVPSKSVCVVTKEIARYRDPLTGYPYSSISTFQTIRQDYDSLVEQSHEERLDFLDRKYEFDRKCIRSDADMRRSSFLKLYQQGDASGLSDGRGKGRREDGEESSSSSRKKSSKKSGTQRRKRVSESLGKNKNTSDVIPEESENLVQSVELVNITVEDGGGKVMESEIRKEAEEYSLPSPPLTPPPPVVETLTPMDIDSLDPPTLENPFCDSYPLEEDPKNMDM